MTILGVGAMGEAIARGLLTYGHQVSGLVRREARVSELASAIGLPVSTDPVTVIPDADVVVLAVKPKDVRVALATAAPLFSKGAVLVSVVAGVTISSLETALPDVAVVRAMPNTPAFVGESVTGLAVGTHADEDHVSKATAVLEAVGSVTVLDESVLDAVTAVSGTGPAYVFMLAEALIEAAIREGMSRRVAELFVHKTIRGAGHLLTETDVGAPGLRSQVTSPGGTTAAAVHVLEERGFRALVEDAVRAAAQRSRELGAAD